MHRWLIYGSFTMLLMLLTTASPLYPQSKPLGVGRAATASEVKAWGISIAPECHGDNADGGDDGPLIGGQGSLPTPKPLKTVISFWPHATTLWDYVNRSMPYDRPGMLPADQVYSVVAYVLHLGGIVGENDVMDAKTLPQVKMPNRDGFVPDPRPGVGK
jgi:cytochrome c